MKFVIVAFLLSVFAEGQDIRGRIFNGQEAVRGQFKYVAVVYSRISYNHGQMTLCGGAIIAPNWVLTAAHCLHEKVEAIVFLGSIDRSKAQIRYKVGQYGFILHSYYNPHTKWNDIALIQIPKTIECDNIAYARMPHPGRKYLAGDITIIMGWGRIGAGGVMPKSLQWAHAEIITNVECGRVFRNIIDSELCANTTAPYGSTCKGDSGGPVVLRDSGELIGVVSCGATCCMSGKPMISMRFLSYMSWITRTTGIRF